MAALNGNKEAVDALLDNGANVTAVDKSGETPLHLAGANEIKTLLQNIDKLFNAVRGGGVDEVNHLISKKEANCMVPECDGVDLV